MKQILDGLGLMPFDEYRTCPKRLVWIKEMKCRGTEYIGHRATGKTTNMICHLLQKLSEKTDGSKVYINGHSHPHTRSLCSQAREYAERLKLDPMKIEPYFGRPRDNLRYDLFQDHYIGR